MTNGCANDIRVAYSFASFSINMMSMFRTTLFMCGYSGRSVRCVKNVSSIFYFELEGTHSPISLKRTQANHTHTPLFYYKTFKYSTFHATKL